IDANTGAHPYTLAIKGAAIKIAICPSDPTAPGDGLAPASAGSIGGFGISTYVGNVLVYTPAPKPIVAAMKNGTSNTAMIVERYANCRINGGTSQYWTWWGYIQPMYGSCRAAVGFGWTTAFPPASYSGGDPQADYSSGNLLFQVAPAPVDCNSVVTQTP